MRIKKRISERIFDVFNYSLIALWAVICLYPMLYVLFASLSDASLLDANRGLLFFPLGGVHLEAYRRTLAHPLILSGYLNTIFVVVVGTIVNLVMTSLGAYFLSRRNVFWKPLVMVMIVITMYFGGGLIPNFLVVRTLGLLGSRWALIIPAAISTWNLIVMRTVLQNIPDGIEEAAIIDGAGHFRVLVLIILPLSKAVLAVMALWYGVGHWNSWFAAAIYLSDREMWPIQLVLREVMLAGDGGGGAINEMTTDVDGWAVHQVARTLRYAMIIVATVPILFIYPFLQKYFMKGVMIGSLKG